MSDQAKHDTAEEVVIRGGMIVTMDPAWRLLVGDVAIRSGRIVQVGGDYTPTSRSFSILDAEGSIVMPGLVQSHVHTCQTLARGHADDLSLLDWLRRVVWPYEASLTREDVASACRLALVELLLGGTTAIQDMGTVHHADALFEVAEAAGIRALIGKAMMDEGVGVPDGLRETTAASIEGSVALCKAWNGRDGGRLRYAFAPRFVLSCTEELLQATCAEARRLGARIHTHASENRGEIEAVRKLRGDDNVAYLDKVGMTGDDVGLAHCVWLEEREREVLRRTGTHLLHCPSSNLKLASGVASIPELRAEGIKVSLGADGAPCNNNLDAFLEMRLCGLIHKPRCGAEALPASQVVKMATLGGAEALGLGDEIGSLELGKRGDVSVVDIQGPHVVPTESPYSALVYACRSTDVRHVVVDGAVVVRDRNLMTLDAEKAVHDARQRGRRIFNSL
ncbi:MAG: 5'-deoxyadenosine deaminase [Deltaproteobacteria bacterium]|nr:5'-deoxyadenosine deaminase [Deltaproteobacteria bacterium]